MEGKGTIWLGSRSQLTWRWETLAFRLGAETDLRTPLFHGIFKHGGTAYYVQSCSLGRSIRVKDYISACTVVINRSQGDAVGMESITD